MVSDSARRESPRLAAQRTDRCGRKLLLVAGEVSGDRHGAGLARELLRLDPALILLGAGGDRMAEAGVDVRVHTVHLGCVGFTESFRLLRPLRKAFHEVGALIESEAPDLVVLIDNEGFNSRLAKILQKSGVPVVFYFAPQVWLWGAWRARRLARLATLILAAFEPEAAVYRSAGGNVEWVGHPLLDATRLDRSPTRACLEVGLNPADPIVALLPGSRIHEIRRLAPTMLATVRELRRRYPRLQAMLLVSAPDWKPLLRAQLAASGLEDVVLVEGERYDLLSQCTLAITKSGTSTLELALLGVPHLVVYKIGVLSYRLAQLFANTSLIAMPNILLGKKVVPEFTQSRVTVENLTREALALLDDPDRADSMRVELSGVRLRLGEPGAAERAAQLILDMLTDRDEEPVVASAAAGAMRRSVG